MIPNNANAKKKYENGHKPIRLELKCKGNT